MQPTETGFTAVDLTAHLEDMCKRMEITIFLYFQKACEMSQT